MSYRDYLNTPQELSERLEAGVTFVCTTMSPTSKELSDDVFPVDLL
jgi:hypothetical protein